MGFWVNTLANEVQDGADYVVDEDPVENLGNSEDDNVVKEENPLPQNILRSGQRCLQPGNQGLPQSV